MNALVTGASSGLGKEIYNWFKFTYCGFNKEGSIIGVSRRGPDVKIDLSLECSRNGLIDYLTDSGKSLDILVNNAGILLLDERMDNFKDMLNLNLVAVWDLMNKLINNNLLGTGARIINISSVSGIKGEEDFPLYAATKAGVISLTKSYAKKFASKGISVNCVSPGLFSTNLVEGEPPKELIDSIPFKREASCSEIIPIIKMLLECHYMTGSNIVVDGGYLL